MKRCISPLFAFLAILIFATGCGGSGPSLPSSDSDGALNYNSENIDSGGFSSVDLGDRLDSNYDVRDQPLWLDDEVLIVLYENIDASILYPIAKKSGLTLIEEIRLMWGTVYQMHIDSGESVENVVAELKARPEVRFAEPNIIYYPTAAPYVPNDPLFEYSGDPDNDSWNNKLDQWGPNELGASLVWPSGRGTKDVIIAVLDTGCRTTHEDLANQLWINEDEIPDNGIDDDENGYIDDWRSWDVDDNDNDIWDTYGHGTACSGVVGAEQDNEVGCTGIAPGVSVMPIRCDLSGGGGYTSTVIEGVQYAYDNGAIAVSMSFRSYSESEIMHETFIATYLDGEGMLPIGAAGNENSPNDCWPADWPEVFEVGATCSFYNDGSVRDVRRLDATDFGWGSNWGNNLEIMAPGALYITTHYGNDASYYDGGPNGTFGGTSNATPCVAGAVGLLKSYFPEMSALDLRNRLKESADDIHTPGHDDQTGYGRVNIWRAIFGSEPNEDIYDSNGHIPIDQMDTWQYDSIFDVSTAADYDFEDIFVIHSNLDGVLAITVEPITTGQDLDVEIFDTPDLVAPIGAGGTINNENNLFETVNVEAHAGSDYYIRVYSPEPFNCSNFRVMYTVEEFNWSIDWESVAPIYVNNQSSGVPLLKLDFETNLSINVNDIRAYISGDIPIGLVNNLRIYEDTNGSGSWEDPGDTLLATNVTADVGLNQHIFQGSLGNCLAFDPLTLFVVADIGPNELGYNVTIGAGLHSYKDISVEENAVLLNNPFPILSDLTVFGEDHIPPQWITTVGLQDVFGGYKSATLYWNGAFDALSEPTIYNVYMDENEEPDILTSTKFPNVSYVAGGGYDFQLQIPNLENDKTYFFLVRAEDASNNEDTNEIWLDATPSGSSDPEHPQLIGELYLGGDAQEVSVYEKIAYVANSDLGLAIVDCTISTQPVLIDTYPGDNCRGVMYYIPQNYVYLVNSTGLVILDTSGEDAPVVIGTYAIGQTRAVYVDNDICCVTSGGQAVFLDVSDPTTPVYLGVYEVSGWGQRLYGLAIKDNIAYLPYRYDGFHIVDITEPGNPNLILHMTFQSNLFEMQLWGDYALISYRTGTSLYVVDVSDPPNAFLAGQVFTPGTYGRGVAVRDAQYVYFGVDWDGLHSIRWDDLENLSVAGSLETDGPFGLFYDGEFLYSAENEDGLKIYL